jgi:hypothetical protein
VIKEDKKLGYPGFVLFELYDCVAILGVERLFVFFIYTHLISLERKGGVLFVSEKKNQRNHL